MLRLLTPQVNPVGGLRFVDPDTQYQYNKPYRSFEDLETHVQSHRKQNKLPPIDDFRKVWEHWICHQFGMETKCCEVTADISRTFEQYIQGAKAYVRRMQSSEELVSKETAEKRAATCIDCDQNLVNIGHRMSQFYTDRYMKHQVGKSKTDYDKKLFTCKICTCLLRSKVHYPASEVASSLSDTEVGRLSREPRSLKNGQPLKCWQLTALEETRK